MKSCILARTRISNLGVYLWRLPGCTSDEDAVAWANSEIRRQRGNKYHLIAKIPQCGIDHDDIGEYYIRFVIGGGGICHLVFSNPIKNDHVWFLIQWSTNNKTFEIAPCTPPVAKFSISSRASSLPFAVRVTLFTAIIPVPIPFGVARMVLQFHGHVRYTAISIT